MVRGILNLELEEVTGKLVLTILISYAIICVGGGILLVIEGRYLDSILSILAPERMGALWAFHDNIFKVVLVPMELFNSRIPPLWEIVTSIFVHANLIHLFFNVIALSVLGSRFETMLGARRMALIFFTGGVLANLATIGYSFTEPYIASVGASGALFAIAGALAIIEYKLYRSYQSIWWIFMIFIISTLPIGGRVNIVAHAAGLGYGILLGYYYGEKMVRWYRYKRVYW